MERPPCIHAMLSAASEEGPGSRPRRVFEAVSRCCLHTENHTGFLVQVIEYREVYLLFMYGNLDLLCF